ncbi:hypothetical protein SAMN05421863_102315 [Nitrosomonas communis]|uniref:Uncharacterized protein n=1 Tax=Nitrosomonas communis TaxID=44574 RepID=A0A1I4PUV9_9PROT|nr:hypothetical protein SAMN05421863_102315 [Nitrosomonas communis]
MVYVAWYMVAQPQGKAQRRRMAVPFQGAATEPCACKTTQSALESKHPKEKNKTYRKDFCTHNINARTSDQLRNLGLVSNS